MTAWAEMARGYDGACDGCDGLGLRRRVRRPGLDGACDGRGYDGAYDGRGYDGVYDGRGYDGVRYNGTGLRLCLV